mgnify:CR=1 FL=1|jgi:hypothetical protein
MRKRLFFLFFLFSGFLSACENNKEVKVLTGNFPVISEVKLTEITGVDLVCPEELVYVDGYLSLINNCSEELLQLVRVSDWESKFFLKKGSGPLEFSNLIFSGHKQGDSLLLRNSPKQSVWLRPKALFNEELQSVQIIHEPNREYSSAHVFDLGEKWVFNSLGDDGFLVFLDKNHKEPLISALPPVFEAPQDESVKGYVFYSSMRFQPEKRKIVSALRYFPYLIINNEKGEFEKVIQTQPNFEQPEFPEGQIIPVGNTEVHYLRVELSDDFIFLYRPGLKLEQSELEAKPVLEVFDWKGNPIALLTFDRFVGNLDFDFEKGKCYGISFCEKEHRIFLVEGDLPLSLF